MDTSPTFFIEYILNFFTVTNGLTSTILLQQDRVKSLTVPKWAMSASIMSSPFKVRVWTFPRLLTPVRWYWFTWLIELSFSILLGTTLLCLNLLFVSSAIFGLTYTVTSLNSDGFFNLDKRSFKNILFAGFVISKRLPINSTISPSDSIFRMFL